MAVSSIHARFLWQTLDRWGVYVVLAGSLSLNVYLGLKVSAMPAILQSPPAIAVGARAPNLYAEKIDGTKGMIDWTETSKPWLLYIFSPSCVWCQRNRNNFDTIVRERQSEYRIVGLSTTTNQLRDYIRRDQVTYAVYANPDMSKSSLYAQTATPTTYVISPQGVVLAAWRGAYTGDVRKGIEAKLNVQLPGVKID